MNLFKITIITLLSLNVSFAEETKTEEISKLRKWSSYKVQNHSAWGNEACVASTQTKDAILEVYAEKVNETDFTEPTVQMVFSGIEEQVYSAVIWTDKIRRVSMTLASQSLTEGTQAVVARLSNRSNIIKALRAHNTANVRLLDAKGKSIKRFRFSLSGSSKTIAAQFKACELKFEEL